MLKVFNEERPFTPGIPWVPIETSPNHIGVFLPLRHSAIRSCMETDKSFTILNKIKNRITLRLFGKRLLDMSRIVKNNCIVFLQTFRRKFFSLNSKSRIKCLRFFRKYPQTFNTGGDRTMFKTTWF